MYYECPCTNPTSPAAASDEDTRWADGRSPFPVRTNERTNERKNELLYDHPESRAVTLAVYHAPPSSPMQLLASEKDRKEGFILELCMYIGVCRPIVIMIASLTSRTETQDLFRKTNDFLDEPS